MIPKIGFVAIVCVCWARHATTASAQDSDPFRRARQSLDYEYERLDRKSLELRLRTDALNAREAAAKADVARINVMALGIGREAATREFYSVYRPGLIGRCIQCIPEATRTLRPDGVTVTNAIIPGGLRQGLTGVGRGEWLPCPSRADVRRRACSDHGANGSAGKTGS
jgi:hypothetical protein